MLIVTSAVVIRVVAGIVVKTVKTVNTVVTIVAVKVLPVKFCFHILFL